MSTESPSLPILALISSGSRLILDSGETALRGVRASEASLVEPVAAARVVHIQAGAGHLGDVVGLASKVGRVIEAVGPMVSLRDAASSALEELSEAIGHLSTLGPS